MALDLPYPQRRAWQGSHQGPADSSLGVGAHTAPAYCILGGRTGHLLGAGTHWGPADCARGAGCGRAHGLVFAGCVRQGLDEAWREGEAREGGREKGGGGGAEEGYLYI